MLFLSYLFLSLVVFSGALAGILVSRFAHEELASGRRWLAISRKILYILLVACALFFLAPHPITAAVIFVGLACAYFKKIFTNQLFHLFPGFLFFLAARDLVFLLTLSVVLFLFYFVSAAASASAEKEFRQQAGAVILHHLSFLICLPLYIFYL